MTWSKVQFDWVKKLPRLFVLDHFEAVMAGLSVVMVFFAAVLLMKLFILEPPAATTLGKEEPSLDVAGLRRVEARLNEREHEQRRDWSVKWK